MAINHSLGIDSGLIFHLPQEKEARAQLQSFSPAKKQENRPEQNIGQEDHKNKLKQIQYNIQRNIYFSL